MNSGVCESGGHWADDQNGKRASADGCRDRDCRSGSVRHLCLGQE